MSEKIIPKFIDELIRRNNERSHVVFVKMPVGNNKAEVDGLLDILSMSSFKLNDDGKSILDYLENHYKGENGFSYNDFKWKLTAFMAIQDALNVPFYQGAHMGNTFRAFYFYYESKYLLIESILSSLNGFHVANKQLLRNFLEFNLMQLHFMNILRERSSFQPLNEYFKSNKAPGTTQLIKSAIPNDEFCKSIKKRIQIDLNNLSNRYSHAYHPAESPKNSGVFHPEASIDSLFFWVHISFVLETVLWMYYVNTPMLFHPVDITKKFGFNPPLNVFVTNNTYEIVKNSLTEEDFTLFKDYAGTKEIVSDLMSFYNSYPDLNDDEIWATWTKERKPEDTFEVCFIKNVAEVRALAEVMSTKNTKEDSEKSVDLPDAENDFTKGFKHWQTAYKRY